MSVCSFLSPITPQTGDQTQVLQGRRGTTELNPSCSFLVKVLLCISGRPWTKLTKLTSNMVILLPHPSARLTGVFCWTHYNLAFIPTTQLKRLMANHLPPPQLPNSITKPISILLGHQEMRSRCHSGTSKARQAQWYAQLWDKNISLFSLPPGLGVEPRAMCMLHKHCTTELHAQPFNGMHVFVHFETESH